MALIISQIGIPFALFAARPHCWFIFMSTRIACCLRHRLCCSEHNCRRWRHQIWQNYTLRWADASRHRGSAPARQPDGQWARATCKRALITIGGRQFVTLARGTQSGHRQPAGGSGARVADKCGRRARCSPTAAGSCVSFTCCARMWMRARAHGRMQMSCERDHRKGRRSSSFGSGSSQQATALAAKSLQAISSQAR